MNYSSMLNRLTGIKREQMQCAVANTVGIRAIVNDKAVKMYQIQVRRFDAQGWSNYLRPWLMKQSALDVIDALQQIYSTAGIDDHYVYQIVEV